LDELRTLGENLRDTFGKLGIGLLVTELNEKAQLVCVVTDDLKTKIPAGKLVGSAAKILGGAGGGKPHLATAGGKDIEKIPELLDIFVDIVKEFL
jgi:alanyl-tRNA synthetase